MRVLVASLTCALTVLSACDASSPNRVVEATSLLGKPLYAPKLDAETEADRLQNLSEAEARFEQDPHTEDNIVWLGRRLAYLGRYREAIAVYTDGLALFPDSYKLLRHRGHRYITTRRFDDAVADLSRAADLIEGVPDEVEPDGLPNALNIPTSTSHTNIYYHLGLVRYLKGDFALALPAYRLCLGLSTNNDMRCASTYWLYLTLRRLGRDQEAEVILDPITADMEIIENFSYHKLLLLFKGEMTAKQVLHGPQEETPVGPMIDDATLGYGVGAWHLVNGRIESADRIFRQIVARPGWAAFGHIAAEAELARQTIGSR